jgi:hypothetical protein
LKTRRIPPDRYALYEASVLSTDFDIQFVERTFKRLRGRSAHLLREDFAGTAATAGDWVARGPERRAFAVDLDPEPFAWAQRRRLPSLREAAKRLRLVTADVRTVRLPPVDITMAFNFSFWIFKERKTLGEYFKAARRGLVDDGMLVLNTYGGTGAMGPLVEKKRIPSKQTVDGERLPAFRYTWEQEKFNPITNELYCSIHFDVPGRKPMRRAFTYDWRMWTLPETRELLDEAGFREVIIYVDDWDPKTDEPTNVYKKRTWFPNDEGWLAFVVALA